MKSSQRLPWRVLACGSVLALLVLSSCATAPSPTASIKDPAVRRIIDHYLQACGDPETLQQLRSVVAKAEVEIDPYGLKGEVVQYQRGSSDVREELTTARTGKQVTVSNGRTGWKQFDHLGFGWMTAKEAADVAREGSLHADDLDLLKRFPRQQLLPDAIVSGITLHVLALTTAEGRTERWFFDPATGRCVRREKPAAGGSTEVHTFADFRTVNGLVEPFLTTVQMRGLTMTFRSQSMTFNQPLDDALFAPPAEAAGQSVAIDHLLERYIAACGGAAAFGQLRTCVTKLSTLVKSSGVKTEAVVYQKSPNRILIERNSSGMGKSAEGCDGKTGWAESDLQGFRLLRGPELAGLVALADLQGPVRIKEKSPLREWLGERDVEGHRAIAVRLSTLQATEGIFVFDAETGRLLETETVLNGGAQGFLPVTNRFSDFRTVDGVTQPFRTVMTNPATQIEITVESVAYNQPLADAIFAPKRE